MYASVYITFVKKDKIMIIVYILCIDAEKT